MLSSDNPSLNAIADQVLVPAEKRFSEFVERGMKAGVFRNGLDPQFLLHSSTTETYPSTSAAMADKRWYRRLFPPILGEHRPDRHSRPR